jgi:alginate O-acetyltransferase complex protein AlgI
MLFNSLEFLLIFCPIVYAGYFLLAHYSTSRIALFWLTSASFGFYAYWDIYFVRVLCVSIAFNYAVVEAIKTLRAMLHWKRGYVFLMFTSVHS